LAVHHLIRPILVLLGCMFMVATFAGLIGFTTSKLGFFHLAEPLASRVPESRHIAFLTDGWAHAGSYLAGMVGGMVLWIVTWRRRASHAIHGEPGAAPKGGLAAPVGDANLIVGRPQ